MSIFVVDTAGLAKISARRDCKVYLLYELIQNAWDEPGVRYVIVVISREPNSKYVDIMVEDDSPEGFQNFAHAYTLFAESTKCRNPLQRGIFNMGEKMVIASCRGGASIETTKGTVHFDLKNNKRTHSKKKRTHGTVFRGKIPMTREEQNEVESQLRMLVSPSGIHTTINGAALQEREMVAEVEVKALPTVIADAEGNLKKTARNTTVKVWKPEAGEEPHIYEMGIPVMPLEDGDKYHLDVQQRVPVNLERNSVPPSLLRKVRVAVLNEIHEKISPEEANSSWIHDAFEDPETSDEAIETVLTHRFGDRRVIYDPSDPESNRRAVAEGYSVIHGSQLSRDAWGNVKRTGTTLPAGQVTPTKAEQSQAEEIPKSKWTDGMKKLHPFIEKLGEKLLDRPVRASIVKDPTCHYRAAYGKGHLTLNVSRLGRAWFNQAKDGLSLLRLLIHEFAHEFESDHLSGGYHTACCKLGAKMTTLALDNPGFFI